MLDVCDEPAETPPVKGASDRWMPSWLPRAAEPPEGWGRIVPLPGVWFTGWVVETPTEVRDGVCTVGGKVLGGGAELVLGGGTNLGTACAWTSPADAMSPNEKRVSDNILMHGARLMRSIG